MQGCGICCTRIGLPPFETPLGETTPVLPEELIEELQRELDGRQLGVDVRAQVVGAVRPVQPGPCFWLDPEMRRCKHYEHRPQICRDFVCGDECIDEPLGSLL